MKPFGPRGFLAVLLFPAVVALIARTLAAFVTRVQPYLAVHYDWTLEIALVTGQVLFQWCFLFRQPREEKYSYAWIVLSVSALGAALLWPLLAFVPETARLASVAWFFAVVAVMFAVHYLLVVRHELPKRLCVTWVVYRILILAFIVRWRSQG